MVLDAVEVERHQLQASQCSDKAGCHPFNVVGLRVPMKLEKVSTGIDMAAGREFRYRCASDDRVSEDDLDAHRRLDADGRGAMVITNFRRSER